MLSHWSEGISREYVKENIVLRHTCHSWSLCSLLRQCSGSSISSDVGYPSSPQTGLSRIPSDVGCPASFQMWVIQHPLRLDCPASPQMWAVQHPLRLDCLASPQMWTVQHEDSEGSEEFEFNVLEDLTWIALPQGPNHCLSTQETWWGCELSLSEVLCSWSLSVLWLRERNMCKHCHGSLAAHPLP